VSFPPADTFFNYQKTKDKLQRKEFMLDAERYWPVCTNKKSQSVIRLWFPKRKIYKEKFVNVAQHPTKFVLKHKWARKLYNPAAAALNFWYMDSTFEQRQDILCDLGTQNKEALISSITTDIQEDDQYYSPAGTR
nr:hypothetical protein [Actinomycetes bacterium]